MTENDARTDNVRTLTPAQTLRAMLVALHPVIAALAARDEMAVAEYNRVTWLLSAPDEQVLRVGQWIGAMWRRYVGTKEYIEVE